jgi:hypothetical protein
MFTRDFATQVIAPSGHGQPAFVSAPVDLVSTVIAAHPVAWNMPSALVQLLLGAGLLVRRTARLALAASACGTSARASAGWPAETRA